jgi:hypothetical protein
MICKCCNESTHSQSPLEDVAEDDTYGGKRPWLRYKRAKGSGGNFKQPAGHMCLLCWHTFKGSGLLHLHGTLGKYLNMLRTKPEDSPLYHVVPRRVGGLAGGEHAMFGDACVCPEIPCPRIRV